MLLELRIQDFAVIEEATIEFGSGLNVLTGETGAGKSIIVDALGAALGARAGSDVLRAGAQTARVEARFRVESGSPAGAWLRELGLVGDDAVVTREIAADGRSRGWISGRPATVTMLRDLGEHLVEIIGQHESQRLLRPQVHLELLDAFGSSELLPLREEVGALAARRTALRAERQRLIESERDRVRQVDLLRHQVVEIDAAGLQPDEEDALKGRRVRLANAERLAGATAAAYAALYEGDGSAAVDRLGQARAALRDMAALDPVLADLAARIDAAAGELADIAHGLAQYRDRIEDRPDELGTVDDRLALIGTLRRKYGESVAAILEHRDRAAAELATLDASDARLDAIGPELESVERDLVARCTRLSKLRRDAASRLEAGVARELQMLEMKRARLSVAFSMEPDEEGLEVGDQRVAVGPAGIDRVEFLLTANPGEGPRPLAKSASGGELSRVMLALRNELVAAGGAPVMVCDEVDAGIGARTAGPVGALLTAAARTRQVLCVTHLAQVASLADQHYWIAKDVVRGRTVVRVTRLAAKDRVDEIARMLSGRLPTQIAKEYAVELLAQSRRKRVAGGGTKGS